MIAVRNLRKSYRLGSETVWALKGVDMEVAKGEMVAITGPSGSGKSTLLRVLGGLETADEGEYLLNGETVATLSSDRRATLRNRRIGLVFETFTLLPRVSVLENVELPLLYAGRRDAKQAAIQALEAVGLADERGRDPEQLSAGQRQRVALARAVVAGPELLLADEPTGRLGSESGREFMELLTVLNRRGQTLVVATHDRQVAAACGRAIALRDGRMEADAPC